MRESEWMPLETLVSENDGSLAYQYREELRESATADSWEYAQEEPAPMEWTCADDSDDLEFSITPEALAVLTRYARIGRAYTGCSNCARVTRVP